MPSLWILQRPSRILSLTANQCSFSSAKYKCFSKCNCSRFFKVLALAQLVTTASLRRCGQAGNAQSTGSRKRSRGACREPKSNQLNSCKDVCSRRASASAISPQGSLGNLINSQFGKGTSVLYSIRDRLKRMKVARTACAVELQMLNVLYSLKCLDKKDPLVFYDTQ
jgi:hypothetical protein